MERTPGWRSAVAGDAASSANALDFVDEIRRHVLLVDVYLGRTAENELLLSTSDAMVDPAPFSVYGVSGGGAGWSQ